MNDYLYRVNRHVEGALDDAFDAIWSGIVGGRYTQEEARTALSSEWGEAVAGAWDEWFREGEDA